MYVNLHAHTIYSVLDGHATIPDYVRTVHQLGHTHAAITDHGTLAGVPAFVQACAKYGVTPIIGMEAYIHAAGRDLPERPNNHLTLLAMNAIGYRNLMRLATRASLEGFYYKPRIDHALLAEHHEGLIVLSGCVSGELGYAVTHDLPTDPIVDFYRSTFGDRYLLEVMDHGDFDEQIALNRAIATIARRTGQQVVATNDSHFCAAADYAAQQMLIKVRVKDQELGSPHCYVRPDADMAKLFTPAQLRASLAVAERIEPFALGSPVPRLPMTPYELGQADAFSVLAKMAELGLLDREATAPAYTERLRSELGVIKDLSSKLGADFSRYLLMIADIVRFCREERIRFGPRGSAAGSVICWALGISEPDPLLHGLVFERFLNPYRIEMPDIDLDFADDRRDEVFAYITRVYGSANCARIGTYAAIGAKQALRDAGRELKDHYKGDLVYETVEEMIRAIPDDPRPGGLPLHEVIADQRSETIATLARTPHGARLLETALNLEGRLRGEGMHAAGVVIADTPLIDIVPLQRTRDAKTKAPVFTAQTQYEMQHLETLGLLKVDILGLKTLSTLDATLSRINANDFFDPVDPWQLPWDDAATWELIKSGHTLACFQIGSEGLGRACDKLQPDSIDDLAITIAVYRPGPLQNFDSIVARKHGREPIASIHSAIDHLLVDTYGYPIYQEQVMEIARAFAGYTLGEADLLRKAMGKKIREKMAEEQIRFLAGARGRGHSDADARRVWDYLLPFANYGFNKAHAICYAYVAYQTAYLKANYPSAFYAAAMSIEASTGGADNPQQRIGQLIREARQRGINVLPPDIQRPTAEFEPDRGRIRYGFAAIRDFATLDVKRIIDAATAGPYTSLAEFLERTRISTKSAEALAAIGALPWHTRATLVTKQPVYGPRGGVRELSLIGWHRHPTAMPPADLPEWSDTEKLQHEVAHLGMFVTPIPVPHIECVTVRDMKDDPMADRGTFTLRCVILKVTPGVFKKTHQSYARLVVLDESNDELNVMIFPRQYDSPELRQELVVGNVVFLHGRYRNDMYGESFEVRNLWRTPETH